MKKIIVSCLISLLPLCGFQAYANPSKINISGLVTASDYRSSDTCQLNTRSLKVVNFRQITVDDIDSIAINDGVKKSRKPVIINIDCGSYIPKNNILLTIKGETYSAASDVLKNELDNDNGIGFQLMHNNNIVKPGIAYDSDFYPEFNEKGDIDISYIVSYAKGKSNISGGPVLSQAVFALSYK